MELDKIAYITLACLTGLIIILVIAFGTYGSNISKDPSFIMFFKWYIFLFVFNLFNILVTLIFHYIMADIPGEKGLKGFTGDRGLPGESSKCFCQYTETITINAKDIDLNKNIHTRDVMGPNKIDRIGTIIYDGEKDEKITIEHQNAIQQLNKQVAADAAAAAAAAGGAAVAAAAGGGGSAVAAAAGGGGSAAADAALATAYSGVISYNLQQSHNATGDDLIDLILGASIYAKLILKLELDNTAVEQVGAAQLEAAEEQLRQSASSLNVFAFTVAIGTLRYLVSKVSRDAATAITVRNQS